MITSGPYSVAYDRSWMMFVDGENLTIRAQEYVRSQRFEIPEGEYHKKNTFIWLPNQHASGRFFGHAFLANASIRSYYYTSVVGDGPALTRVRTSLWELGFTPEVFKKDKQADKTKGVDISLTRDMLSHAFMNHYDAAVLVSGDGDYVPLVKAIKQQGKRVVCVFFEGVGLSPELKLAADDYYDLTGAFQKSWQTLLKPFPDHSSES